MKSLTHKAKNDHQAFNAPVAVVSPEEAYQRSIELLSDGRQIEAEKIIADAVKNNLDNANLLFAKAVLERSRWSNDASKLWFGIARRKGARTYIADAVSLQMRLDSRKAASSDLVDLIQLSDVHPDDVYLLWLSAIECREQKNGVLGRERYEKLLTKFRVGPVLLHQTYANILEDYLKDYETALKHRYIAVSMEAKGWSLEGLACTLTRLERYQEACAIWACAVKFAPKDSGIWGNWGWTLRLMDRYEEALEKHREACRLNPSSAYNFYSAGWCLRKLGRQDDAGVCYRKTLEVEPDNATALNDYAWFLETCEDESFRNYPEALRLAEMSVAKDEQTFNLDTLALAYEKTGQYAKAADAQKRRIALLKKKSPDKEIPAKMLSRLEKYEKLAAEQAVKAPEQ